MRVARWRTLGAAVLGAATIASTLLLGLTGACGGSNCGSSSGGSGGTYVAQPPPQPPPTVKPPDDAGVQQNGAARTGW